MDDFSVYGSSFDHCLSNLASVPEVLKVRLGVRFPLATTHPV